MRGSRIEGFYTKDLQGKNVESSYEREIIGNYKGREVVHKKGILSIIADAAEELTFSESENVEKDLSKREISPSKDSRIERIKKLYEKYLKRVPDMGSPERLNNLLKRLIERRIKHESELRKELKRLFKDITHQFLALEFLEDALQEEGLQDVFSMVHEAKTSIYETSGPDIRAGLNISGVAEIFSREGLSDIQSLRDFYRDNIVRYERLSELHASIISEFGEDRFERCVSFLIEACGNDLRSQGPSIEPAHLKEVLDELYRLEVIGNFQRDCANLIEQTQRLYNEHIMLSPGSLAEKILTLKEESWITSSDIKKLVEETKLSNIEAKIFFLTNLKEGIRKIPLKAFSDNENRIKFLNIFQEAIDYYIEEE